MPTFETPTPIVVDVMLTQGDLRIEASDRTDTVVEIRPSDPAKHDDVAAAERTTVELKNGRLSIAAPRSWRRYTWINDGSVDVRIELPTGSELDAQADLGALGVSGRLASCRYRTGLGHIAVDACGAAELRSGAGNVDVGSVNGSIAVKTGSGTVRIERATGSVQVKNSNGDTDLGAVTGAVTVQNANGGITIRRAERDASVKTATGSIRLGAVREGTVDAHTATGDIAIGVARGSAAYLDVSTGYGHVDSDLEATTAPAADARRVRIQARSSYGDVVVHRVRPDHDPDLIEGNPHV